MRFNDNFIQNTYTQLKIMFSHNFHYCAMHNTIFLLSLHDTTINILIKDSPPLLIIHKGKRNGKNQN